MEDINKIIITKLCEIRTVEHKKGTTYHIDSRLNCGFTYAVKGSIVYNCQGKDIISDDKHILILPQGAKYHWECTQSGIFTITNFAVLQPIKSPTIISTGYLEDSSPLISHYLRIHHRLGKIAISPEPSSHAEAMSELYRMIYDFQLNVQKQSIHPILHDSIAMMENSYSDPALSNEHLAAASGISVPYFRSLFKQSYGISPMNYVSKIRISKAKAYLLETNQSVASIAAQCGYTSVYHFSRIFKQKTGFTPSEYRKNGNII